MSEHKPPYDHLSEEQLMRYLRGELSAMEAHELERKVLDSDFESEAMEGWEQLNASDLSGDLREIRSDISKNRRKPLIWWQLAAVGSLLIVSGIVLNIFLNQLEPKDQVVQEAKEQMPEVAPTVPKAIEDVSIADSISQQQMPIETPIKTEIKTTPKISKKPQAPSKSKAPVVKEAPVLEKESKDEEVLILAESTDTDLMEIVFDEVAEEDWATNYQSTVVKVMDTSELSKRNKRQSGVVAGDKLPPESLFLPASASRSVVPTAFQIIGNIQDKYDQLPISGASINVKGTNISTTTDASGYFSISSQDANSTIEITYDGYETQEIKVDDSLKVSMEPNLVALEDVTLFDFDKKEEEDSDEEDDTYFAPAPEKGWEDFRAYIQANLKYPDAAKEAGISGTVKLKVNLSDSGEIQQISVKKSLGFGCDAEAMRLIQNGPQWLPAARGSNPYESSVVVRIRFRAI